MLAEMFCGGSPTALSLCDGRLDVPAQCYIRIDAPQSDLDLLVPNGFVSASDCGPDSTVCNWECQSQHCGFSMYG